MFISIKKVLTVSNHNKRGVESRSKETFINNCTLSVWCPHRVEDLVQKRLGLTLTEHHPNFGDTLGKDPGRVPVRNGYLDGHTRCVSLCTEARAGFVRLFVVMSVSTSTLLIWFSSLGAIFLQKFQPSYLWFDFIFTTSSSSDL